MKRINRKSAPHVNNGRVQKQNNWDLTANYYNAHQSMPVIDRQRPGANYRHILKQKDIEKFIGILPDWPEVSRGLNGIVLSPGSDNYFGYHVPGVIHICAWEKDYWLRFYRKDFEANKAILLRLNVPYEIENPEDDNIILCKFNEDTVRGFQLLDVFLHELGHHHDRMATKSKIRASRGEPYAETYAKTYSEQIWLRYQEVFKV